MRRHDPGRLADLIRAPDAARRPLSRLVQVSAACFTFDVAAELVPALADRTGAWRFVERFAAAWHVPLGPADGCDAAALDAAEVRLGVTLPVALREAYALFGHRTDLTSNQDVLLAPQDLFLDPAGRALVFRVEHHAVAFWGVRVDDLDDADPPVVLTVNLADRSAAAWHAWLDTVSSTCVEMVLSESLYGTDALSNGLVDRREQHDADGDRLMGTLTRVPLPDYPTSGVFGPGVRWYAGGDVIIRDDARTWLSARCGTPEALAAARSLLPGEWPGTASGP